MFRSKRKQKVSPGNMRSRVQRHSVRLYEILESVGASKKMRHLHSRSARLSEMFQTITASGAHDRSMCVYNCGSSFEGTVTPGLSSDVDSIICFKDWVIVLSPDEAPEGEALLMTKSEDTYPGHVKLQFLYNRQLITTSTTFADIFAGRAMANEQPGAPLPFQPEGFAPDNNGYFCKTHIFIEQPDYPDGPSNPVLTKEPVTQNQGEYLRSGGPAWAIYKDDKHVFDLVSAVKCDDIPAFGCQWIHYKRPYGWPSTGTIRLLTKRGCMAVGAGYMHSSERHIEWRLSLSLQERILMTKMNDVQHKTYVLLKMIKRDLIQSRLPQCPLTSYHCKTCVFYAIESTPSHFWRKENLILCLLYCLSMLRSMVVNQYCPNYFIRDQNLLTRSEFRHVKHRLSKLLHDMLRKGPRFLEDLKSDKLGSLMAGQGTIDLLPMYELGAKLKFQVIMTSIQALNQLLRNTGSSDWESLFGLLGSLSEIRYIQERTAKEKQAVVHYLRPWIHLHIAMSLAAAIPGITDTSACRALVRVCDSHFKMAEGANVMNIQLAKVTILYKFGKYNESYQLLIKLDRHAASPSVLSFCPCPDKMSGLHPTNDIGAAYALSTKSIVTENSLCCLYFLPSERNILPAPLALEMRRSEHVSKFRSSLQYWFDWAVVDPRVYMYLIIYQIFSKQRKIQHRQVVPDMLVNLFGRDKRLGHIETACNILGFMAITDRKLDAACHYLIRSWQERRDHNAAKFLIRDIFRNKPRRQRSVLGAVMMA